jgi:hypothetical protein
MISTRPRKHRRAKAGRGAIKTPHQGATMRTNSAAILRSALSVSIAKGTLDAFLAGLTAEELTRLHYDFELWARDDQLPPGAAQPLAQMFVRGAGAMTAVEIRGLEALRRRLEAAAAPQAVKGTFQAEAGRPGRRGAARGPRRAWGYRRSHRSKPRNEACLRGGHSSPGGSLPRIRDRTAPRYALALAGFPRPFTRN